MAEPDETYTLGARIGAGASSEVFEARDARGRRFALKLPLSGRSFDEASRRREAEHGARVHHTNVVGYHGAGRLGGLPYVAMELVEGRPFVHAYRPPSAAPGTKGYRARVDDVGLRHGLGQLVEGVAAIHAAGLIHRDLSPGNVVVTQDGRVVILDLGLSQRHDEMTRSSAIGGLPVGTPGYMSPEAAYGEACAEPSDWYSVGAMLYETLTGTPPQRTDGDLGPIPHPKELDASVPDDLADLAHGWLAESPPTRPGATEVRRRLAGGAPTPSGAPSPEQLPDAVRAMLPELLAALEQVRSTGAGARVVVEAPRDAGRSALLHAFAARAAADASQPHAQVLRASFGGSSFAPWRGLDALVRELMPLWRARPQPRPVVDEAALATLFRDALPQTRRAGVEATDPRSAVTLRAAAIRALRELLGHLAEHAPLVLLLDDLDLADGDVRGLLDEVLRDPTPAHVLAVATWSTTRSPAGSLGAAWRALRAAPTTPTERPRPRAPGLPEGLPEVSRRALASLALLAAPVPVRPLARALECTEYALREACQHQDAAPLLTTLRAGELIALRSASHAEELRLALPDKLRDELERVLAVEFRSSLWPAMLEAELRALERRGERAQLMRVASAAGQAALERLGSRPARRLFELALAACDDAAGRSALHVSLATALELSGDRMGAYRAYEQARRDADWATGLVYGHRGIELLMLGGHYEEGIDALTALLREGGLGLPRRTGAAIRSVLWERGLLKLRGLSFQPRDASELDEARLRNIDVLCTGASSVALVLPLTSIGLATRCLRLALAAGERSRVSRALNLEAMVHAVAGGRSKLGRALACVNAAAESALSDQDRLLAELTRGYAHFWAADLSRAIQMLDGLGEHVADAARLSVFDRFSARLFRSFCLRHLGAVNRLRRYNADLLLEARSTDDKLATLGQLGAGTLAYLADDDAAGVERLFAEARVGADKGLANIAMWWVESAEIDIALYRDEPELWPRFAAALRAEERSMSTASTLVRSELAWWGARVLLHDAPGDARLVKLALGRTGRMRHATGELGEVFALLIEAGAANLRGDPAGRDQRLRRVSEIARAAGFVLYAAVAEHWLVVHGSDPDGRYAESAHATFAEHGVRRPERIARTFGPGIGPVAARALPPA